MTNLGLSPKPNSDDIDSNDSNDDGNGSNDSNNNVEERKSQLLDLIFFSYLNY
jgi:hypothetical protein